jgi:uncharacterized protein YjiS (DUF1127 family)
MSHVHHSHTSSRSADWKLVTLLKPFTSFARRIRERHEMNALLSMPDYQLRDIGLTRSDIQREAVRPIWRA